MHCKYDRTLFVFINSKPHFCIFTLNIIWVRLFRGYCSIILYIIVFNSQNDNNNYG